MGKIITFWGKSITFIGPSFHFKLAFEYFVKSAKRKPLAMEGRGIHAHKRNVPSLSRSKAVQSERLTWISLLDVKSFKSVFIATNLCAAWPNRLMSNCFQATSFFLFSWPLWLWLIFSKYALIGLHLRIWGKYMSHAMNNNKYYPQKLRERSYLFLCSVCLFC